MKGICKFMVSLSLTLLLFSQVQATYNDAVVSTLASVQQMSTTLWFGPETFVFTLDNPPNTTWCGPYHSFAISPATISDAQTRKNMVAILLTAKASGGRVQVAFDNTGGFCDQGFMGVYYVVGL